MSLDTSDGRALIGYAGLGATAQGNEPADWIAGLLRNRGGLSLEQTLQLLAESATRNLPHHMAGNLTGHVFVVSGYVSGQPAAFSVGIDARDHKNPKPFLRRHLDARPAPHHILPTPFFVAGSGAANLVKSKDWERPLMRLIAHHDQSRLKPEIVAARMAFINTTVSASESTVGPSCIVAWRIRPGARVKWGSAHACFAGTARDPNTPSLPTIANGMDLQVLLEVMRPYFEADVKAMMAGGEALDHDKACINAALAKKHTGPHDKLK